jgi:hypothetical protein
MQPRIIKDLQVGPPLGSQGEVPRLSRRRRAVRTLGELHTADGHKAADHAFWRQCSQACAGLTTGWKDPNAASPPHKPRRSRCGAAVGVLEHHLMKNFLITLVLASSASLAFAHGCPKDMAAIDARLATNPKLSDADKAKVQKLRADGEAAHKAGKHDDSMKLLAEAKKTLGI